MRFTNEQYNQAINDLEDAKRQLEPDGNCCSICSDNGHMAFECGFNPLLAMHYCRQIATESRALHETLHVLGGFETHMGERLGPARIILPEADPTENPEMDCRDYPQ